MNKSEIAEQIVEYVRRNHNSRSDELMKLIAEYDGERAIAESQAPQCPKCGSIDKKDVRCLVPEHPHVYIDHDFCRDAWHELGDGEPSPPPTSEHCYCVCHSLSSSCSSCVHCKPEVFVPDWGDSVDAMVRDFARVVGKPAKSEIRRRIYKYGAALVSVISGRSGAAQEVSPSPGCPFGYMKESPGTKHICAIHSESDYEDVSPPSPEQCEDCKWHQCVPTQCGCSCHKSISTLEAERLLG